MKRKLLIAFGLTSPLVFLTICFVVTLVISGVGWWLLGENEQAQVIRIMALAPLKIPATDVPQAEQPQSEPAPDSNAAQENLLEMAPSQDDRTSVIPPTSEEVEQALGFSLPAGSVNSITQEGIATRLVIPKLKLNAPVIISPIENQTWKVDHLGQQYIGHLEGTARPGAGSNIVLAAHVTVSTGVYGPFVSLAKLEPGDQIFVYYGDQIFEYLVDDRQTVDRTAVEVTYPSEHGQVTLITCSNWDDNENRYLERLVVKGNLKG